MFMEVKSKEHKMFSQIRKGEAQNIISNFKTTRLRYPISFVPGWLASVSFCFVSEHAIAPVVLRIFDTCLGQFRFRQRCKGTPAQSDLGLLEIQTILYLKSYGIVL